MTRARPSVPGKHSSAVDTGDSKVVRFFSVEGQRRRLEFAGMPLARAMTPEEETRHLSELQTQEEASRTTAEADGKAAREPVEGALGRATRGRHEADAHDEPPEAAGRRSGGRAVTPAAVPAEPPPRATASRAEVRRGIVSRRGVIGAPQSRAEE